MHAGKGVVAPQRARAGIRLGPLEMRADAELTAGGLLAIGGMVSAILLSTAVLVRAAVREGREARSVPRR
ncbi:hypothetical protein [Sphingomonas sp.]|uniref:hypothetical protein n=1 Tax=Sphingomonas sp. TaxID=28214 RepID=UPI0035C82D35